MNRAPVRVSRGGVPRWLPVLGIVLVLLAIAGAIASLSGGGSDKAIAPVTPAKKNPAKAKKKDQGAQSQQTQSTTSSTAGAPAAGTPNPDEGSRLHAQAFSLVNQGQYDQAIALEKKAIPMLENSGRMDYWYALYNLGHALRLAGHPAEAIPILEKRLQNPNQRGTVQAELNHAKHDAGQ